MNLIWNIDIIMLIEMISVDCVKCILSSIFAWVNTPGFEPVHHLKRWADSDVSDLLESGDNDEVSSSTYKVSKRLRVSKNRKCIV